ncbi:ATP-binding response regulator [endosymbiont of unidentified scaly snail isolate Monju]|uniref:ATP-binding response regulator n=1 Tax=endosymbiont of unidentified scaly snail isolate Monju TaxID=1248727 RepID=UPI000389222E|nr:response regulator [endosymbiont of unidentified scaly snail isolate Monju]BAN69872.1 two-component system sensor histidine kinase [endosymbiont of unidentified scaly snail isolate Monju]
MNKPYEGFKLLAVDDNPDNLFTLRTLLSRHMGVEILEASSGTEALEIAQAHPDIDLIILDVQMPEVDGFETAQLLKARKKTRDIPIIFLTAAFKSEEFQQRGYEIGAVDYLLKPIDDNQLINKVSTYFRLIEKERQLNQILEQKVAERTAELQKANQHLRKIVENMGEALFVLWPDGRIMEANPAAQRLLGYSEAELQGMSIGDVFEEEGEEQANAFMGTWLEALIRSGALKDIEAALIDRKGERVPILFSRTAITNEAGEIEEILCIAKKMRGYRKVDCED